MERTRQGLSYRALCLALLALSASALLLLNGCTRSKGASEGYMEAEELLGRGKFLLAVEKYDSVAREYASTPFAPRGLYKEALIYNRFLEDRKRAIEAYYRLLSLYPDSAEAFAARRDLAVLYSASGDHTKAVEQYQWLLDSGREPAKEGRYRYTIALEYFRMNDLDQAEAELKDLLAMAGNGEVRARALLLRGDILYMKGELDRAMGDFREVARRYPGTETALQATFDLARALEEAEREDEALELLEGIRERYPNRDAVERTIRGIRARREERRRAGRRHGG